MSVSPARGLKDRVHDPARLAALYATGLLDSPPEECFDRYTRLASTLLDIPVTLITLIDRERQFFKSQVGLPEPLASERGTVLERSFCRFVVDGDDALVIEDSRVHPLVRDNPAVEDGNIAYLGVPLRMPDGHVLGTFCAVLDEPHSWSERDVGIMLDLAVSVMTEIELRLLASKLEAQYEQLRAAELQRDEMVHMLVHDLRNPLTSLLAGLALVDDTSALGNDQQQALNIARRGGDALLAMVNEVLDVNKGEAGRLQMQRSPVDPAELIACASEQMSQLAQRAGVTLTSRAARLPPCPLDADKLRRVLVNLVANAVQHTPRGGRVELIAEAGAAGQLRLRVSDTGPGIPEAHIARLFDKFANLDGPRRGGASTGLGLAFCKLVVEAHGGSIGVDSRLGQGTTFTLELPVGA